VTLHGGAPETTKADLLARCGVFVQHSLTDPETGDEEGLPASIQEAMAHGLAVVSTRHAGIPEAVVEGETGLLVDEGDVVGMAAAIAAVGPRAQTFGAAGYRRATALYGWEQERARLRHWLFDETATA
jgi:glycosyltransferase involved in cell wall biosynthesis